MRIISGALKGRKLIPPSGKDIRPTSDRAKETLFNILSSRYSLADSKVLELFCGSGAMGFEFISRGAASVMFVDIDTSLARKNAAALKVDESCSFVRSDALRFLSGNKKQFNFVFADPPYGYGDYEQLVESGLAATDVFILEHPESYTPDEKRSKKISASRREGKAFFTIFDNSI